MKRFLGFIGALAVAVTLSTPGFSKCMRGDNWTKDGHKFYVCIKGDSFADRKKGKKVCEKVKGSSCDKPNTFSSSCNGHCYDANGKEHHSLSGF